MLAPLPQPGNLSKPLRAGELEEASLTHSRSMVCVRPRPSRHVISLIALAFFCRVAGVAALKEVYNQLNLEDRQSVEFYVEKLSRKTRDERRCRLTFAREMESLLRGYDLAGNLLNLENDRGRVQTDIASLGNRDPRRARQLNPQLNRVKQEIRNHPAVDDELFEFLRNNPTFGPAHHWKKNASTAIAQLSSGDIDRFDSEFQQSVRATDQPTGVQVRHVNNGTGDGVSDIFNESVRRGGIP